MSFKMDLWNYQTWENIEPRQEASFCEEGPYCLYSLYNTGW